MFIAAVNAEGSETHKQKTVTNVRSTTRYATGISVGSQMTSKSSIEICWRARVNFRVADDTLGTADPMASHRMPVREFLLPAAVA